MNIRTLTVLSSICAAIFLVSCGSKIAGNGSDIGNAAVAGILYNQQTGKVAANATVHIRKRTTLADTSLAKTRWYTDTATVTTDANGKYAIDSIAPGTYVIECSDGNNNLAFIDSIVVTDPSVTKWLNNDTLRPAGAIKGVIRLSEGGDPRKVFVLAYGLDRMATVDSLGNFMFKKLAQGTYTLRFLPSLDSYGVLDTAGIHVRASDTNNIGTINIPFSDIPTPTNVTATYDTLNGIAKVIWNHVTYGNLLGYIVYRTDPGATIPHVISGASAISDTFFFDTLFSYGSSDTNTHVYKYQVKVQAKNASIGTTYSNPATVTAVSPAKVRTFITLTASAAINDTLRAGDTVSLRLTYKNATRNSSKISWYINRADSLVKSKTVTGLSGADTLKFTSTTIGKKNIYVTILDASGISWKDTLSLTIINDYPVAHAGSDTSVNMNHAYTLHGTASHKLGSITKWEWNINNTGFRHTASGDTTITTPTVDTIGYPCVLRVTNDRGIISTDTLLLTVGKWEYVGNANFISSNNIFVPSLSVQDSIPYVSYLDKNSHGYGYVAVYTNNTWTTVGSSAAIPDSCTSLSMALINATPYVVYNNSVARYNGTTWERLGPAELVGSGKYFEMSTNNLALAGYNNQPYIAFSDSAYGYKTSVMSYNGTTWTSIGARGISSGITSRNSLVIDKGILYVAFLNTIPTVMKYTGSAWTAVGTISDGGSDLSLAIDNDTLYLAYANTGKIIVRKYNGSAWVTIGTAKFSSETTSTAVSLKVVNGTPYIAFADINNNAQITVMKYNGTSWVNVGTPPASGENVSLVIVNGTPYIEFASSSGSVSVMRYK
jgi:hypothetical protein